MTIAKLEHIFEILHMLQKNG